MKVVLASLLIGLQTIGFAYAGNYPERPIALIVPFAAGGATDAIARALAARMSLGLHEQVVVDNRAGAAGAIGAMAVSKAPADGYTLLLSTSSTHVILPLTRPDIGYDPIKNFAPISVVASAPNILIASPKLPVNSVSELIAYAGKHPGQLNFASSGQGTITHLIGELFIAEANIKAQHIPYKSGVQSFAELSEGQVHFLFDSIVWSLPQIRNGALKGLAITSAHRSSLAPEIPTVAESGLPDFEATTWFGLSAPAGTPENVLSILRAEIRAALSDADFIKRLAVLGAEPLEVQAEDFNAMISKETKKWGEVVKRTGVAQ